MPRWTSARQQRSAPAARRGSKAGWRSRASPTSSAAQVRFDREWTALRRYANERGVRIIGDLPIYVASNGADVPAQPEIFDTSLVAGVPPDLFTETGQLWGNPTYRWATLRKEGYGWWIDRFRRSLQLFDAIRLDHFRAFVAYWAVDASEPTALRGRWRRGPGRALFDAVASELGALPLIAEDLGYITPAVYRLRDELGIPGMHVLQAGFEGYRQADKLDRHLEYAVVYPGTHDNDTAAGWWRTVSGSIRARVDAARRRAGIESDDPGWTMTELTLSSPSRLAIVPLQDVLGLGSEARMNTPGTIVGNWEWRLAPGLPTDADAARLRVATARWGREPASP